MGKRGVCAEGGRGGKVARTASPQKVAPPQEVAATDPATALASALQGPLVEACAEQIAGEMGASAELTAEMLCTALPLAVASRKDERHTHQMAIIACIEHAITAAVQMRQTTVDATEADVDKHAADQKSALDNLEEAKGRAAASKECKDQKASVATEACEAVVAAKRKVADIQGELDARDTQHQKIEAERGEYEALRGEAWEKLKVGELGQPRTHRNKVVSQVLKMLEKANMPPSLGAAIDIVLKTRPEKRGSFAAMTLEHGEALFAEHVAALSRKIDECAAAMEERNAAVAAAESALREDAVRQSAAEDEQVEAENAWAADETQVYEIGEVVRRAAPRASELEQEREEKKGKLESLQALKSSWDALVDPQVEMADAGKDEAEPKAGVEDVQKLTEPKEGVPADEAVEQA